ncbi:hypothetical protein A2866_06720 [Candidatus Roizmanbacteria bacterium RIFCSPHIGHO2_01_FULL_39_8]|uniref:Uncharacterized protein n=3 Tax=Candidatus Roizmaniibacteriota TaxID=1752723 RepID=A0A1F7GL09_9BACT|nr:MAG: hypothetical protein A2866_06720 [Candidatus Roizmanbacteria bacterium RIFCSPHIGHO2_01_FULL_39_8]OGK28103.1 MAG: hypothetical protein A3C28_05010 [Candidatus Roizmanbacteria bacterium RIFCSPHIGHO2_02_FULL_39_9]OGK35448.1 MAG: hypothetical protein A3F60_04190 [Candidatus Roizmanbacteria bacterium RIFCSPHIGHO2_12_FULL_39_8]
MYTYSLKKLPKNTVEISVLLPKQDIEKYYSEAFKKISAQTEIQGFRKGKAPKHLIEKQLKREVIYEEIIRGALPQIYEEILKKEQLKPVISPKIELVKAKENEDWEVKITVAEKPVVKLASYKDIILKVKAEKKKGDIWVPGKGAVEAKETNEVREKKKQSLLNSILGELLKQSEAEIPDLIIEGELERRLSNLLSDIRKIGLTVDAYLKSKNITQEQLKKSFRKEIEDTYKLEFLLSEVADKENITVKQEEIDKLFQTIQDPKEKEVAKANSYFYASILRKQKTLDYLLGV